MSSQVMQFKYPGRKNLPLVMQVVYLDMDNDPLGHAG
jgi:hypothetical protein